MGRSDLQGEPWHYEYLPSKKNSYNCIYCDREYDNRCLFQKSSCYNKECEGKKRCDYYQSKYVPSSNSSTKRKKVETWGDYYLKIRDYDSIELFRKHNPKHLEEELSADFKVLINTNRPLCRYLKDGKCGKTGFINQGLNCGKPQVCKFYEVSKKW